MVIGEGIFNKLILDLNILHNNKNIVLSSTNKEEELIINKNAIKFIKINTDDTVILKTNKMEIGIWEI